MGRLRRFEGHRFVGDRDTMVVYDTDDDVQSSELSDRIAADDLMSRRLVATFGPDSLAEARNRGYRPLR